LQVYLGSLPDYSFTAVKMMDLCTYQVSYHIPLLDRIGIAMIAILMARGRPMSRSALPPGIPTCLTELTRPPLPQQQLTADQERPTAERFFSEVATLRKLQHPNVAAFLVRDDTGKVSMWCENARELLTVACWARATAPPSTSTAWAW
jgi:hypothetical protein